MQPSLTQLTFEFLRELYSEYERDPLPSNIVPFDDIWTRVTDRFPGLDSDTASSAFNALYAERWIKQWTDESGKKSIQISEDGIVAFRQHRSDTKVSSKEKEDRNWKFLTALVAIAGLALAILTFFFTRK